MVLLFDCAAEVKAKNNHDTEYSLSFGIGKESKYISSGRRKDDDSFVYITCSWASAGFVHGNLKYSATAHGAYSLNGNYSDLYHNNKHSSTKILSYNTEKGVGSVQLLSNYINESGASYARVLASPISYSVTFTGVWSPDYKK